ncbi:Uncharacterised protein [Escherichia coli]|nr:Uncharacterised protein [Escherichia coli]VWN08146.1 Uncharacterised protein [Escherichia coli]
MALTLLAANNAQTVLAAGISSDLDPPFPDSFCILS